MKRDSLVISLVNSRKKKRFVKITKNSINSVNLQSIVYVKVVKLYS